MSLQFPFFYGSNIKIFSLILEYKIKTAGVTFGHKATLLLAMTMKLNVWIINIASGLQFKT